MSLKLEINETQAEGVWLTVKLLGTVWMATKLNKAHSVCVGVCVCQRGEWVYRPRGRNLREKELIKKIKSSVAFTQLPTNCSYDWKDGGRNKTKDKNEVCLGNAIWFDLTNQQETCYRSFEQIEVNRWKLWWENRCFLSQSSAIKHNQHTHPLILTLYGGTDCFNQLSKLIKLQSK